MSLGGIAPQGSLSLHHSGSSLLAKNNMCSYRNIYMYMYCFMHIYKFTIYKREYIPIYIYTYIYILYLYLYMYKYTYTYISKCHMNFVPLARLRLSFSQLCQC